MFRMGFTASNNCSHCKGNTPDNYIHALWFCPPVQRYWYRICEDLSKCLKCSIPASPLVCLLGDLDGVTTEDNTIHMAFTALCIAKKTVLMNWKNKNNLNINQYRDYLWDYISLETASADTLDQSLWAPLISSITYVGGGPDSVRCGFVVGVGWAIWAWGIWGSLGVGFLGGSARGCGLAWMGYWVTLECCFSGAAMRRCWGCLCRRT